MLSKRTFEKGALRHRESGICYRMNSLHSPFWSNSHIKDRTISTYEEDRSFRLKFSLLVSFGGVLGLFGNGLLLCFYGNKQTRTYRTRDAIYIRRQACADILVCCIVIPYTILFEADLVNSNSMCKMMEFVRHFLIYVSHLLLYTYAWELPQRHMYSASKTYSLNTLIYSVIMSLIAATPTLFIFKVDREFPTNIKPIVSHYKPNHNRSMNVKDGGTDVMTCRLMTSLMPQSVEYDIRSLTWIYVILPILVYSLSLYWFLINLASYINTIDAASRKDSRFLSKLEDVRLFRASNINVTIPNRENPNAPQGENADRKSTKQLQQVFFAIGKRTRTDEEEEERESEDAEKEITNQNVNADTSTSSERVGKTNKKPRIDMRKISQFIINADGQQMPVIVTSDESSDTSSHDDDTASLAGSDEECATENKRRKQTIKAIKIVQLPHSLSGQKLQKRRATGLVRQSKKDLTPEISTQSSNDDDKAAKIEIVEWDPGPKNTRPILADADHKSRVYPQVGSYKKSLSTLIMVDLVIILMCVVSFLLSGANSVLLSLVHFKSIFTFYFLAVSNPYLRHCVFGSEFCGCLPGESAGDEIETELEDDLTRPSVLQVSFVRERYRQKKAVRKLKQQKRQQMLKMYGTEI